MHISRKNTLLMTGCLCVIGLVAGVRLIQTASAPRPSESQKKIAIIPATPPAPETTVKEMPVEKPFVVVPKAPSPDAITAKAYLVGDIKTGTIYIEHNSINPLPVASMSKLITAIVATDTFSPTTTVSISNLNMKVASDTSRLVPGETFTMHELLYPMLLNSSNVAAEAIASTSNRAEFLALMSSYSWEVGASTAFFADPSGLDKRNIASARDLFSLARYLYVHHPDILELTRTASTSVATTTDHGAHDFVSIHPFVKDPRFIGGKTGRTSQAGDTMMTILHLDDTHDIVCIILGSGYNQRAHDTTILFDRVKNLLK